MHILLLSAGGGGGNILRSVKASFRRDLAVTQKTDSRYAERLRRAVTTRFLDTNEFALSDLPKEERVLIGTRTTGRLGARHDPEVALQALNESRSEVEALFSRYSIIILVGTGGKGHWLRHDVSACADRAAAEEARDPDLRSAIVRAARSGQTPLRPRGARDRAVRFGRDPADRDSERPRIRGTRSAAPADRVGADESSDCQGPPRADLRPVGSLAGRSVRSLDAVCRSTAVCDIGFAEIDPPDGSEPSDEHGGARGTPLLRQSVLRLSQAGGDFLDLHSRRLVEPRGCEDQGAAGGGDGRRCQKPLQSPLTRAPWERRSHGA